MRNERTVQGRSWAVPVSDVVKSWIERWWGQEGRQTAGVPSTGEPPLRSVCSKETLVCLSILAPWGVRQIPEAPEQRQPWFRPTSCPLPSNPHVAAARQHLHPHDIFLHQPSYPNPHLHLTILVPSLSSYRQPTHHYDRAHIARP